MKISSFIFPIYIEYYKACCISCTKTSAKFPNFFISNVSSLLSNKLFKLIILEKISKLFLL